MQEAESGEGLRCLCVERQAQAVQKYLTPGAVVLDVGCGPALNYQRPVDTYVIGLDASFDSVCQNSSLDLRIFGTAVALPLPDKSLDAIFCFYSLHHMVGETLGDSRRMVDRAFSEFARVLKPNGHLYVCEVTPWWPVAVVQECSWNLARRVLGRRLDVHFWSRDRLLRQGARAFNGASVQSTPVRTSMFGTFPPVFNLPWLKVPRMVYPFDAVIFEWHLPG